MLTVISNALNGYGLKRKICGTENGRIRKLRGQEYERQEKNEVKALETKVSKEMADLFGMTKKREEEI